ncbi:VanZ family protein [Saccharopolyspora sp. K220]|uniref:VanZ family protein n=1 Tax=Saccharopolyspora soli TaxID=2926618 RepID=UPI001F5A0B26|nr:VanZ family protein [Saccharopolyspora soli]MCI2420292.1 VanZ family protein [Saccharopolyspora soli]
MSGIRVVLALAARGSAADVQQILVAFDGFVPAVTILFPIAVMAGVGSAAVRKYSATRFAPREPLIDGALVYAALCIGYLVFTPQPPAAERFRPDLGKDVSMALAANPGDSLPWVQLAGNLVLLLPLGVLVPQRVLWFDNIGKIALGGLAVAASIELIQFLAITGRVASTDDVVCNTIGATVGGLVVRMPRWLAAAPVGRPQHSATGYNDQTVWLLIDKIERERQRYRATPIRRRVRPARRPVLSEQRLR